MKMRLELEFEKIDDNMQDVMDVEEIRKKQTRIKSSYLLQQDDGFTSAHIKAARKILKALKRLRAIKERNISFQDRMASSNKQQFNIEVLSSF